MPVSKFFVAGEVKAMYKTEMLARQVGFGDLEDEDLDVDILRNWRDFDKTSRLKWPEHSEYVFDEENSIGFVLRPRRRATRVKRMVEMWLTARATISKKLMGMRPPLGT